MLTSLPKLRLVYTARIRGMIYSRSLTWLKPSAQPINMARRGLVDIGALVAALESPWMGRDLP